MSQEIKPKSFCFVDSKTVVNDDDNDNDEVQGFFFGTLK